MVGPGGVRAGAKLRLTHRGTTWHAVVMSATETSQPTEVRRHRFVRTSRAQAVFATAPTLDYDELRHDLDVAVTDERSDDPLEGTGL